MLGMSGGSRDEAQSDGHGDGPVNRSSKVQRTTPSRREQAYISSARNTSDEGATPVPHASRQAGPRHIPAALEQALTASAVAGAASAVAGSMSLVDRAGDALRKHFPPFPSPKVLRPRGAPPKPPSLTASENRAEAVRRGALKPRESCIWLLTATTDPLPLTPDQRSTFWQRTRRCWQSRDRKRSVASGVWCALHRVEGSPTPPPRSR